MTTAQRLELRASEIRQRLNVIAGMDDLSDDVRAESDGLTEEYADVETKRRAAIVAESDAGDVETHATEPDAEARERNRLRDRASLGGYLTARIRGVLPGRRAGRVLGAACGVEPGTIPLDLFESETRAPAIEDARGCGELRPRRPRARPSARSIRGSSTPVHRAVDSGSSMPRVGSGSYSELTISTALTAGARTKGEERDSTAAALTAVTAKPRSISARLSIRAEDVAEIGTARFEPALRDEPTGRAVGRLRCPVLDRQRHGAERRRAGRPVDHADRADGGSHVRFDARHGCRVR